MLTWTNIIVGFIILNIGIVAGYTLHMMARQMASYVGTIKIIKDDDKLIYSLELQEDPKILVDLQEVTFKVETSDQSSIRK